MNPHETASEIAATAARENAVAPVRIPAASMDALMQIAKGVAPALNDLLTVITGRARLLLDANDGAAATRESLREIYTAGESASNLIGQLLLFSGCQRSQPRMLGLTALIAETEPMLRHLLGDGIALDCRLAADLPPVAADAALLEHAVVGLALNARDAMPRGGRLVVATGAVTLTAHDVKSFPGGRAGDFVVLSVVDTGHGIAPEILPRIFEPFFTTQPLGRRVGLGLAAIFGIVQQHAGWVAVDSKVDAGTEVRIFLPAAPAGTTSTSAKPDRARDSGGGEALLLVEDDPAVREFTAAVLLSYGYRVLQAATAADALEVWKWHGTRIELLLTDMVLPDHLTGLQLAEKLRAEKPGLRVIMMSGQAREVVERPTTQTGECQFLSKPCRPQALARAVRAALDTSSP